MSKKIPENIEALTLEDKFNIFDSNQSGLALFYLLDKFNNLVIEMLSSPPSDLITLFQKGKLEGWCWETTETAILFMKDSACIERGYLTFDKTQDKYFHSWICFELLFSKYVFDPCLSIICREEVYRKLFQPDVVSKLNAKEVRDYFINYMLNPPKKSIEEEERKKQTEKMFKMILGEHIFDRQKGEIVIPYNDDINSPMFRNGVGYKAEIKKDKIKRLVAHYYYKNC